MSIFKRATRERNTEAVETVEEKEMYKDLRERMEMKEYISFDDVRKHLVEMIEENKNLREEVDSLRTTRAKWSEQDRKRAELAQISADEYKSQLCEAKKKTAKLEEELQKSAAKLEQMERERNEAITELEMMRVKGKQPDRGEEIQPKVPRKKKTVAVAQEKTVAAAQEETIAIHE